MPRPYRPNGRTIYRDHNENGLLFYVDNDNARVYQNGMVKANAAPVSQPEPSRGVIASPRQGTASSSNESHTRSRRTSVLYPSTTSYAPATSGSSPQSPPIQIPERSSTSANNSYQPSSSSYRSPSSSYVSTSSSYQQSTSNYQANFPSSQPPTSSQPTGNPGSAVPSSSGGQSAYSIGSSGGYIQQPQPETFFMLGRVFAVEIYDRSGYGTDSRTQFSAQTRVVREGVTVYRRIERFVVVAEYDDQCRAAPLTTYNGQGVSRPGVVKSEHAVIFTSEYPPDWLPGEHPNTNTGEVGMKPEAIRVRNYDLTEKLQAACRINYGAARPFRHTAVVKMFGMVHPDSLYNLRYHYRDVALGRRQESSDTDTVRPMPITSITPSGYRPQPQQYPAPQAGPSRPTVGPGTVRGPQTNTMLRSGAIPDSTDTSLSRRAFHGSSAPSSGNNYQMFPQFQRVMNPREFFTRGRVFSVIFDDTTGGASDVSQFELSDIKDTYGNRVRVRVRKYVVVRVRNDQDVCLTLPILTYGGYGVSAPGVRKSEHGVIYTGRDYTTARNELPRQAESPMRSRALLVIADDPRDELDTAARINYGQMVPIPFATRVKAFGVVHDRHRDHLERQWASVYSDKKAREAEDDESSDDGSESGGGNSVAGSDQETESRYERR